MIEVRTELLIEFFFLFFFQFELLVLYLQFHKQIT